MNERETIDWYLEKAARQEAADSYVEVHILKTGLKFRIRHQLIEGWKKELYAHNEQFTMTDIRTREQIWPEVPKL